LGPQSEISPGLIQRGHETETIRPRATFRQSGRPPRKNPKTK